jgi:hypothetical protein
LRIRVANRRVATSNTVYNLETIRVVDASIARREVYRQREKILFTCSLEDALAQTNVVLNDGTRQNTTIDAETRLATATLVLVVGLTTVAVNAVAIGEHAVAVEHTLTVGIIHVFSKVSAESNTTLGVRRNSSQLVDVKPDTARVINVLVVPVALNSVTALLRIDVVVSNVNGEHTPILNLETIIIP